MTLDLCAIVAGVISFWEESTGATLILAYPTDWQPEILYAEWMWAPDNGPGTSYYYPGKREKKKEFYNGNSTSRDFVGPLQDLLRTVEQTHGIVIDHIVKHEDEGRISVLWHAPGSRVRKHGWAPIAAATVPALHNSVKDGVEA